MSVLDEDTWISLEIKRDACFTLQLLVGLYSTHKGELTKEEGNDEEVVGAMNPQSSIGPHKGQKSTKSIRA